MNRYEYVKFVYAHMGGGNWVEYGLIHETDYIGTDDEVSYDVWVGANEDYINVWEGLDQPPYEMEVIPDPDMSWYLRDEAETEPIPGQYVTCWYKFRSDELRRTYRYR